MTTSGESDPVVERERDRRLLRLLLAASGTTFAARFDRDLRYTWVHNPEPEPPEAAFVGRSDAELFPAVETERTTRIKRRALETGEPATGSYTRAESGSDRQYEATAEPIREDGEVVGVSFVAFDVTEEHRLTERTKALRRQNEHLEEFAGIVSHDLRNPLSVARGCIDLARIDEDLRHLRGASRALERMGTLVEELLVLARQGKHVSDAERVDLDAVAERAWETTDTGAATVCIDTGAVVRADGGRLLALFENLFRNGVEHGSTTPHSQPREDGDGREPSGTEPAGLHVRVGLVAGGDGFYVEDDGTGIPTAEREQVFDYGFSTAREGTGFGLAIVQNVAHAHGWDVTVVDGADGGARFELTNVSVVD